MWAAASKAVLFLKQLSVLEHVRSSSHSRIDDGPQTADLTPTTWQMCSALDFNPSPPASSLTMPLLPGRHQFLPWETAGGNLYEISMEIKDEKRMRKKVLKNVRHGGKQEHCASYVSTSRSVSKCRNTSEVSDSALEGVLTKSSVSARKSTGENRNSWRQTWVAIRIWIKPRSSQL